MKAILLLNIYLLYTCFCPCILFNNMQKKTSNTCRYKIKQTELTLTDQDKNYNERLEVI